MSNTRQPAGLFVVGRTDGAQVPLYGVDILAMISGTASEVQVSQSFKNDEDVPIEAVYTFPLPESAAVSSFVVEIDGKVVKGAVEEKEKAFEKYDAAMQQGHGAFLADQDRPNVFTVSAGNLLPNQKATIRLGYVTELEQTRDSIRMMIPTTVSPRYIPAETAAKMDAAELDHVCPPTVCGTVPYGLHLKVDIDSPVDIKEVSCPSHSTSVKIEGKKATVELMGEGIQLDQDFVLCIKTENSSQASAIVADDGEDNIVMLNLFPNAVAGKRQPCEFVFVVDRSGSMMGPSIEQARNALLLAMRSMRDGDRFNVVAFGMTSELMFERSVAYSQQSLNEASMLVSKMEADMGGTEIMGAMILATKDVQKGSKRQVLIITDGQVGNEDEVIKMANSQNCRLFTFGCGCGGNEHLLASVARSTGGKCEASHPGERIEPKIMRQVRRMTSSRMDNIKVEWGALEPNLMSPSKPLVLYAGDRFTLYARVRKGTKKTKVTIVADGPDGEVRFPVNVDLRKPVQKRAIAVLMARRAIQEIEEAPDPKGGSAQEREKKPGKAKILELALRYQLMSSETSFVAIEERKAGEQQQPAELRRVPVAMTKGWHGMMGASGPGPQGFSGIAGSSGCSGYSGCSGFSGIGGQSGTAQQQIMYTQPACYSPLHTPQNWTIAGKAPLYPAAGAVVVPEYTMPSAWDRKSFADADVGAVDKCALGSLADETCMDSGLNLRDDTEQKQLLMKLHDVPKKLNPGEFLVREGYLDASADFSNVSGAFSKLMQPPTGAAANELVDLLLNQCADGGFELTEHLLALSKADKAKIKVAISALGDKPIALRIRAVATLLAIGLFDLKFGDRCSEWEMAADKAHEWLSKNGIEESLAKTLR